MEKFTIEIPSGTISITTAGEGRPVIFLHGLFTSSANFDQLFDRLPDGIRAIAPDLPDCGGSHASARFKPGWERYGQFVSEVADHLDLQEYDLLGHSMGGGISIMHATGWPGRVRRLVLVDAVSLPFEVPLKGRLPLLKGVGELMFRLYGRGMFFDYFEKDVFHDPSRMDRAKIHEFFETFVKKRPSALAALRATANPDPVAAVVSRISCPTLLLWGANDGLIPPSIGRRLEGMIPDAKLTILDRCGHVPIEERPDEAAATIYNFLAKDDR